MPDKDTARASAIETLQARHAERIVWLQALTDNQKALTVKQERTNELLRELLALKQAQSRLTLKGIDELEEETVALAKRLLGVINDMNKTIAGGSIGGRDVIRNYDE